jgi:hypothetical protein
VNVIDRYLPTYQNENFLFSNLHPLYRYIEIQFLKEEFYKGVKGYTFATNNLTLRASTTVKEEDCFCTEQTKGVNGEDTCFLDGVIDMQPCTGK